MSYLSGIGRFRLPTAALDQESFLRQNTWSCQAKAPAPQSSKAATERTKKRLHRGGAEARRKAKNKSQNRE